MPALYADASALTKLVWNEQGSVDLVAYLGKEDLISSELAVAEVPLALRRIASENVDAVLEPLLERAYQVLDEIALHPVEPQLLEAAGLLAEPSLRTLDAVHVVTAAYLQPLAAFITYDMRQAAAARLAGLRTIAPGL